jgi:hypothetical protein
MAVAFTHQCCPGFLGWKSRFHQLVLGLQALATYREALAQNPQSSEVATKVKRLTQVVREKKRNQQEKPASKANGSLAESEPVRIDAVSALLPCMET